jgi:hypothetical protein
MATPDGDITPALTFATKLLAPRAPTSPEFLEDLERTMALLIFPPDELAPPLKALLDPDLRRSVANRVNEAILLDQGMRREASIRRLLRLRAWSEQKAREAKKDIPEKLSFGLDMERTSNSALVAANGGGAGPGGVLGGDADGGSSSQQDVVMQDNNGANEESDTL